MNLDIGTVPVKSIARRTTAASILLIVNKVLSRKPRRIDPMVATLILAESCLIPIVVRKSWIALTVPAVGKLGVDAVFLCVCHCGATVIGRIGGYFGLLKYVWGNLCSLEPFTRALEHGLK